MVEDHALACNISTNKDDRGRVAIITINNLTINLTIIHVNNCNNFNEKNMDCLIYI